MKKITIPSDVFKFNNGKEMSDGNLVDFIVMCMRTAPASQKTLDKVYEAGKLVSKLKKLEKDAKEFTVDNDDYKAIKELLQKEMFALWQPFANPQTKVVPNGWEAIGFNPLSDTGLAFLDAIETAIDTAEVKAEAK